MPYDFVNHLTLAKVEGETLVYCSSSKVGYRICNQSFELLTKLQAKDQNLKEDDFQRLEPLKAIFGAKGATKKCKRYEFIRQQGLVGCQINGCYVMLSLSILFKKWRPLLVFSLFVFLAVLTYYQGTEGGPLFVPLSSSLSWSFSILAFSTIVHELGHIQAAVYYGVKDYAVGVGFYYGFPVLFTDVSSSYLLKRSERMAIALAGVYFELLYSTILLLLYLVGIHSLLLPLGVLIFLKSLYNLNPFFKTDGYWILSDYLGVYHLKQKALDTIISALKVKTKKPPLHWGLLFYGVSHYVFYVLFLFLVIHQLTQRWESLKGLQWSGFNWEVLQTIGLMLLSAVALYQLMNAALQAFYVMRNYFSISNLK